MKRRKECSDREREGGGEPGREASSSGERGSLKHSRKELKQLLVGGSGIVLGSIDAKT